MVELATVNKVLPEYNLDYHKKGIPFYIKSSFKNNKGDKENGRNGRINKEKKKKKKGRKSDTKKGKEQEESEGEPACSTQIKGQHVPSYGNAP